MKARLGTMNCKRFGRELGIADAPHMLSAEARRHATDCSSCTARRDEHIALKRLLRDLDNVSAPSDFDLRLHARLVGHRAATPTRLIGSFRSRLPRLFDQPLYVKVAACCLPLLFIAVTFNRSTPADHGADRLIASSAHRGEVSETSEPSRATTSTPPHLAGERGEAKAFPERKVESNNIPHIRENARRARTDYVSGMKALAAKQTAHERRIGASEFKKSVPVMVSTRSIEVTRRDGQGAGQPMILDAVSFGDDPLTQTAKLSVKDANMQQGIW